MMKHVSSRISLGCLLALLLLSGCRTYGGYDSEEAYYTQIQVVNEQFADALNRARADLSLLKNAGLSDFSEGYQEAVERHERALAHHEELAATLDAGSSYRTLNRALGAILSEQKQVWETYQDIQLRIAESRWAAPHRLAARSRYQGVPLYYASIENVLLTPSMEKALR